MDDLTITRLCAEAMGLKWIANIKSRAFPEHLKEGWVDQQGIQFPFRPLHDDAQAMALVKKINLSISRGGQATDSPWWKVSVAIPKSMFCHGNDLNRAICECVAKMEAAKVKA